MSSFIVRSALDAHQSARMDSEDGDLFIKHLASFVRSHEKALASALQNRRETRHRPTQSTSSVTVPRTPTLPERPSTSASSSNPLTSFSLGALSLNSNSVKSAKLALTPHHLFYLLSRFEDLSIAVGPMKVRLENLHDTSTSANYVSFLSNTHRSRSRDSDVGSIRSVSSVGGVMSSMSALWASLGISASISAARTERQKAALESDLKYLYSAFTKIPCLRLAPDWRARLIRGYEEFPFDSAVPLYAFKNLQSLEVSNIDFRQFFGWDRLADQLRSLSLKRAGIEDPADILIDIVLDDMDQRRRRSSKSQASPTATMGYGSSPRRGSTTMHHELQRSMTAPLSNSRHSTGDLRIGSLTPSEHAIEDSSASDSAKPSSHHENHKYAKSPESDGRPRSTSPTRMGNSRSQPNFTRSSERIKRSGSGSSHSSFADGWPLHSRGSSGNLLPPTVTLPSTKWRFLRHLSLAENGLTTIPATSLQPLSNTLFSLDLSANLFSQVPESLATLTALRALNLSHCMIDSLHSLTRNPLPAITALNLRANRLTSLAGIEKLFPLERLDLRDNGLTDPMELARLTGIPDIREIWVEGNNFTRSHRDYRVTIFNIFRKTPGYTDDITIDGSGPTYSEKRLLVDRVPIPDSIPVVKPKVPEMAPVDVTKPAIVYGAPKEPGVLRKERPVPKTIMSEVSTSSTRRRKTPKRRIVDLSTGETPPSPTAIDIHQNTAPSFDRQDVPTTTGQSNYRISHNPQTQLLSSAEFEDGLTGKVSPQKSLPQKATIPRVDSEIVGDVDASPSSPSDEADQSWRKGQDWGADGENYRLKIQALRDKVGNDYLSVLSEESWDTTHQTSFVPSPDPTNTSAGQPLHLSDHTFSPQLRGGHTLGQPLSS